MYKIIFQNKMFFLPTYPIFFRHVIGNRLYILFGLSGNVQFNWPKLFQAFSVKFTSILFTSVFIQGK